MASTVGGVTLDTRVLDAMIRDLDRNADQVLHSIALQVEAEAKPLAPVDTGALVNSIHTEKVEDGLYRISDGVEYGIYQELGTSRMAAQPFMVPAISIVSRSIADRYKSLF